MGSLPRCREAPEFEISSGTQAAGSTLNRMSPPTDPSAVTARPFLGRRFGLLTAASLLSQYGGVHVGNDINRQKGFAFSFPKIFHFSLPQRCYRARIVAQRLQVVSRCHP